MAEAVTEHTDDYVPAREAPSADPYLVWSNEHNAWWRGNRCGYTKFIDQAGRYERSEALNICRNARNGWRDGETVTEIPLRLIDAVECMGAE